MCKDFQKSLGENLRKIRHEKALSQEYISLESGISRSHIAMIESGKRDVTVTNLFKISRALQVQMQDIFAFDNLQEYKFDVDELYK